MKVVVLGYGKLAQAVILGTLQARHEIVGVMRWEKERPNRFKAFMRDVFMPDGLATIVKARNLSEIRAKNTNSKRFIEQVKKLAPDVIIVSSWGEILQTEVLELPKVACINCHPSMLPKHRGSNPYVSAIREGEVTTGITFHLMDENIDTGDILLQEEVPISAEDNAESLKSKCAFITKQMIPKLLNRLERGELIPQKQNEEEASYFPPAEEDDVIINWEKPAEFIHNQIRAFSQKTGCYTRYNNDFLFLRSSRIVNLENPVDRAGMVLEKNKRSMLVSTGELNKAIFAENIKVYGFLSELWSQFYIDKNLKENTCFKKI